MYILQITTEALCVTLLILVLCTPRGNRYPEFGVYHSHAGLYTFTYVHIHKQLVALFVISKCYINSIPYSLLQFASSFNIIFLRFIALMYMALVVIFYF